jgi:hypothetical protein
MCVDYTDLNHAYKKDPFGLAQIDQVMDSTSFITPFDMFCYTTMPIGLQIIVTIYHRGIQKCLHNQLKRNTEAYVNDVVIKTQKSEHLISTLTDTFDN